MLTEAASHSELRRVPELRAVELHNSSPRDVTRPLSWLLPSSRSAWTQSRRSHLVIARSPDMSIHSRSCQITFKSHPSATASLPAPLATFLTSRRRCRCLESPLIPADRAGHRASICALLPDPANASSSYPSIKIPDGERRCYMLLGGSPAVLHGRQSERAPCAQTGLSRRSTPRGMSTKGFLGRAPKRK